MKYKKKIPFKVNFMKSFNSNPHRYIANEMILSYYFVFSYNSRSGYGASVGALKLLNTSACARVRVLVTNSQTPVRIRKYANKCVFRVAVSPLHIYTKRSIPSDETYMEPLMPKLIISQL